MQKVKAKFRCNSITDFGFSKSVKFSAIYGKEGENADFSKATPSGQIEMMIDNETKAADLFQPQKDYYLTFEAVPE